MTYIKNNDGLLIFGIFLAFTAYLLLPDMAFANSPFDQFETTGKEVAKMFVTKIVVVIGSFAFIGAGIAFLFGRCQWTTLLVILMAVIGIASAVGFCEWLVGKIAN